MSRTDGWTDGRMEQTDNVKTVYPTTNKVCGGIISVAFGGFVAFGAVTPSH